MKVLGISRSTRFSPNSVGRDEAIFMAVASRLERRGCDVSIISEDLFVAVELEEFDGVFSMARGKDVLSSLAQAETQDNLFVLNSARALAENTRAVITTKFEGAGIPQPHSVVCPTADYANSQQPPLAFPIWLKRGDACAQTAADVQFVSDEEGWGQALTHFHEVGADSFVAVEHLDGDLVKFYGVEGTTFFHTMRANTEGSFSKFGLEQHNSACRNIPFSEAALKQLADQASRASGFTVYGGDAIISPEGDIRIIDFNDWPSFSACRKDAAKAIAQRFLAECPES